jgi:hypothetical protein
MTTTVPPLVSLQTRFDALLAESQTMKGDLDRANQILDAIHVAAAFEDKSPTSLVLADGTPAPRENPEIVVSITVNGKGVRTACVYSAESVTANGWPTVLAEACMSPLGLLARDLAK